VVSEPGPVTLEVGGQVTLELQANPTTGYSWELTAAPDTAVVRLVSDDYVRPAEPIPGAGGDCVVRLHRFLSGVADSGRMRHAETARESDSCQLGEG